MDLGLPDLDLEDFLAAATGLPDLDLGLLDRDFLAGLPDLDRGLLDRDFLTGLPERDLEPINQH